MLSKPQRPMASAEPKRSATARRAAPKSEAEPRGKEKLSTSPAAKMGADALPHGRGPGSICSEPVGAAKNTKAAERGYPVGMTMPGFQLHYGPNGQPWYTDGKQWWPVGYNPMMASQQWSTPFSSWTMPSQQTPSQQTAVNPKELDLKGVKQNATRTRVKTETKEEKTTKGDKKDKSSKEKDKGDRGEKKKKPDKGPPEDVPDWGGDDEGDEPDPEDDTEYTYEEESEEEEEHEPDQSVDVTPRSATGVTPRSGTGGEPREGPRPGRRPAERDTHHTGSGPRRRRPPGGGGPPSMPSRGSQASSSHRTSSVRTESVRQLLKERTDQPEGRARANLGQVRLETFSGDRSQYRNWMKTIQAQKQLYQIQDKELAVLLFLSCTGEAREVLNQLEIADMQEEGGLQRILRLLEDAYGSKADERFEERQNAFLSFRRSPGQSIAAYLATLKRLRNEYLREDPGSVISDRAFAQRMLTRASLTRRERYDCFFAAGGSYRSGPLEKVLRFRCANVHLEERPSGGRRQEERGYQQVARPPPKRRTYKRSDRRAPYRATRHAHVADEEDLEGDYEEHYGDNTDDEDLEQEALMAEEEMPEEEEWSHDEEAEYEESVEAVDQAALQEAFAAGWRAKNQTAQARQSRGYRDSGKSPKGKGKVKRQDSRRPDDRKRNSTCASCGQKGHWRGDAICPNVKSGKDAPHRKESATHYTTASGAGKGSAFQPKRGRAPSPAREPERAPLPRRKSSESQARDQAGDVTGATPKHPPMAPPPNPPRRGAVDKSPMETYVEPPSTPRGHERPPEPAVPPRVKEEVDRSPSRKEPEREPKASPEEKAKKRRRRSHRSDRPRRSSGEHRSDRDRTRERKSREEGAETPADTPREGTEEAFVAQPSTGTTARQCNWTYMVGGWDVIKDYDSDSSDTISSHQLATESEEDDLVRKYQLQNSPAPKSAAREKLKVKLMTVLRSLAEEEQDDEVKRRLQRKQDRLRDKISARAVRSQASGSEAPAKTRPKHETRDPKLDEEMGLSTQDLLQILPNMSKEEKKLLYKQLKKEREDEALKLFGTGQPPTSAAKLKRPDRRRDGYSAASVPMASAGHSLRKD